MVCAVCGSPLEPGTAACQACGTPRDGSTSGGSEPTAATASGGNRRAILIAGIFGVAAVVVVGGWLVWQSFDSDDADTALPATTTSVEQASTTAPASTSSTTSTTTTTTTPTTTTPPPTATTLPGDLVTSFESTGVFVGPGSDADRAVLEDAVADARSHNWDLSVAAFGATPEGGVSEYAASIAAVSDAATVVVVTPDALGWAPQEAQFYEGEFERARSLIPAGSDEGAAVQSFVRSVLGGPDSVGTVNVATARWDLLRSDDTTAAFTFGDTDDIPFIGDWDCDGIDTPGVWRDATREIFLRNDNTDGPAEISYEYFDDGARPIVGDFDGDGCDTVSFYYPEDGSVWIFNTKESAIEQADDDTPSDTSYVFGDAGDIAFVGDFDGDGIDTLGLYRPSSGTMYLKNSHTEGPADIEFLFGDPGDLPVAGDWGPEDGIDTVALYRPDTGVFFFRFTNSAGPPDATLESGAAGGQPVAGAFGLDRTG